MTISSLAAAGRGARLMAARPTAALAAVVLAATGLAVAASPAASASSRPAAGGVPHGNPLGSDPAKNGNLVFDAVDNTNGTVQIFRVSAGGTRLKQLTATTGQVWNEDPAFTANGQMIYFGSLDRATTGPSHIYRMSASGKGRQLADEASAPTHVWPSVNAAGTSLAVVQYGKGGQAVIATMKTNGTNRTVVAKATSRQGNGSPDYAPNNGRLAFFRVTYNKNGQGIARSDLFIRKNGRNTDITTHSAATFFTPSWAPDGRRLLAIRGQHTIVSMKPNGTDMRVLTRVSGASTSIADAVYSPSGKEIAYLRCIGDCGDPRLRGQGSVWVMNADGTGRHRVFNGTNGVQPANRLSWGRA
jgi:Tol biopolymer transport system component